MKIKLSEIENCGKSLIFEAGEIDKLKKIVAPTNNKKEKAMKNIAEILNHLIKNENEDNPNLLKKIKANIEEIEKSIYLSGIFKGLELERVKAVKWNYGS